jgi:hypothetical protein
MSYTDHLIIYQKRLWVSDQIDKSSHVTSTKLVFECHSHSLILTYQWFTIFKIFLSPRNRWKYTIKHVDF